MTIAIVHDSELGNGERLANAMRERLSAAGHTVTVGHERTLRPAEVLAAKPALIVLGTAVRKFSLSPVTKGWIDELGSQLAGAQGPRACVFVTHALKPSGTEKKGARIRARLAGVLGEDRVKPGWISAQVAGPGGPFVDGVEDAALKEIDAAVEWAGQA